MKFKILGIILALGLAIQFVPYGKNHNNPPVVSESSWNTPRTRQLFFKACFNCHSNETVWPWYSKYAPVSWLIQRDVDEGREHFNISMWGVQRKNAGDDAVKKVSEGEMPPWFYLIPNPSARLSESEKDEFITGLKTTFGEGEEDGHKKNDD